LRAWDLVVEASLEAMKSLAQASAILAVEASRARYLSAASRRLRGLVSALREALRRVGVSPDEPPRASASSILDEALTAALREAQASIKAGRVEAALGATSRFMKTARLHLLAYAEALRLMGPRGVEASRVLEAEAKRLRRWE